MKSRRHDKNSPITKNDLETAVAQIAETIVKYCASKEDLKSFATKDDLDNFKAELQGIKEELKSEIGDVKRQLTDLKADTPTPQEVADHERRIKKLEGAVFPS